MYKNKSIFARAKFAVIYSVYKTEENLLKNKTIADRLFPQDIKASIIITCPQNSTWSLVLPQSNLLSKFQNNFIGEFGGAF